MILLTSFRWKNEIGQLTLIGSIGEILDEFFEQSAEMLIINKKKSSKLLQIYRNSSIKKAEQSVVMIQNDKSWGTGCLVKINGWNMVLTCSHVIWSNNSVKKMFTKYFNLNYLKLIHFSERRQITKSSVYGKREVSTVQLFTKVLNLINRMMWPFYQRQIICQMNILQSVQQIFQKLVNEFIRLVFLTFQH